METITITLPAIDETLIATISQLTTQVLATEKEAYGAIRRKYAELAKQNGYVRIAWTWRGDGSNWSEEKDYYYERSGKRIKALLCLDGFYSTNYSQNAGSRVGHRLYLLATGERMAKLKQRVSLAEQLLASLAR